MTPPGLPTQVGETRRQTGAIATAIATPDGLRWEVRRERDGLLRITHCLADSRRWSRP